jgi:alanine dehydrogenase
MIVGVLKEIKTKENRVALTPYGAKQFVARGHEVLVERHAGAGSGFSDEEYVSAGAKIVESPKEICERAELVLKIKEPLPQEYGYFRPKQMIFTYFHFASSKELTLAMIETRSACIAYETVEVDGKLPLLAPMSSVAGQMAPLIASWFLAKHNGGRGVLLSGLEGAPRAKVVIIGAGFVGENALKNALALRAEVTVIEKNEARIEVLKKKYPEATFLKSTPEIIDEEARKADVLIGAVLLPGAMAPKLVKEETVKNMKKGAVIVDVAIDQGGCVETARPTTHEDPVYEKHGVIHYCVTNMPGAYPRTSTIALTNATLPYAIELADKGLMALKENEALKKGLNIYDGKVVYKAVADAFGLPYTPVEEVLKDL